MKEPKSQVIEMPNENLDAPKVSQDKDFYQKDGEYPVEIKTQEPGSHSDEGDEVTDHIWSCVLLPNKTNKILNFQKSSFIRKFSRFFFFIILSSFPLLGLLSRIIQKSSL